MPWETVSGGSGDKWETVSEPVAPQGFQAALRGATGISETPWYSRGMFAGRGPSAYEALQTLPAVGGAVGGLIAAPGFATAVGGAALGGAAGEATRQNLSRLMGIPAPATSEEAARGVATEGAIQGGLEGLGRGLVGIGGRAVKKILPLPEKQYAQALGATTNANKQLSEKIVPELISRRVTGSREGIKELAEKQIEKVGGELDVALAQVPKGKAVDVGAVFNQLQKLKKQYVVPSGTAGVNQIVDKSAYDALGKMQTLVAGTQATHESVRRLRQILDGMVTAGDKTFGRTIAEGSELDATREAANAIRRELAATAPNVAKINKEFSFWMNVDRVVGDTIRRTASQSKGVGQQIAEGVATPAGAAALATGNAGPAAAIAIPVILRKVLQSPAWKTFSAVQKDRLAEAIASGNPQRIAAFLAHGTQGAVAYRNAQDDQP